MTVQTCCSLCWRSHWRRIHSNIVLWYSSRYLIVCIMSIINIMTATTCILILGLFEVCHPHQHMKHSNIVLSYLTVCITSIIDIMTVTILELGESLDSL